MKQRLTDDAEMELLREEIGVLKARVIVEKEVADYWYNRCIQKDLVD